VASSLIGSLRVALGLDTAQFEAGANKSRSIARGLSRDIESSFKSAKIAVEGLVAAFAIGALTSQIKQSLQYAAAIGEMASTLGVTTKQLQEFRFAAQQVGVSQEALDGGLQRLTVSIGKSKLGSEAQTKAFDALAKASHTTVEQLRSGNTGDVFVKVADALSKVTDRSQRAAAEVALFGKTGALLDSLLAGGSARLNALADAAHQLGVVLSEDQIRNAEVTAHKLEALKTVLEANIASTVTANANSILSLAQALSTLTNEILHFFSSHPQLALAIIGGLAGSRFGVAGAIAGTAGGYALGEKVAENAADQNMDLRFRMQQVQNAKQRYLALQKDPGTSLNSVVFAATHGGTGNVADAEKELRRQTALLQAATAAATAPKPSLGPGVNLPPFLAPKGGRGRKPPADRSEELLAQMDKEILQADQEILQSKLGLAGSADQHLQIQVQLVQLEKTVRDKAIDEELAKAEREHAEHKITDAALKEAESKAAQLKAANAIEAQVKLQAIVEEQLTRADKAQFEASDQQRKFALDALHVADQLATTQEDHRRIQLQILDSEINQRRLQLEHEKQLAIRNGATADEIKVIQDQIDHLPAERAQGAAVIGQNTMNPLEKWAHDVPKTAAEIKEALQSIEVEGIDKLSDALTSVVMGTESLKQAFHDLAASILADLLKMTIKMLIFRALSAAFGSIGGAGASAGGGGFSSSTAALGGAVPGFASGGSFLVGGRGGTDMNVLSINGIPKVRVSASETVSVGNDNGPMMPGVNVTNYNDFRGADPAAVAAISQRINQMEAELPGKVVGTMKEAQDRFIWRR
jgi:hypothetical protein